MLILIQRLVREGANVPPVLIEEAIRADLIQRARNIEVTDWDEPCTELELEGNERPIVCQGTLHDILQLIDETFN